MKRVSQLLTILAISAGMLTASPWGGVAFADDETLPDGTPGSPTLLAGFAAGAASHPAQSTVEFDAPTYTAEPDGMQLEATGTGVNGCSRKVSFHVTAYYDEGQLYATDGRTVGTLNCQDMEYTYVRAFVVHEGWYRYPGQIETCSQPPCGGGTSFVDAIVGGGAGYWHGSMKTIAQTRQGLHWTTWPGSCTVSSRERHNDTLTCWTKSKTFYISPTN